MERDMTIKGRINNLVVPTVEFMKMTDFRTTSQVKERFRCRLCLVMLDGPVSRAGSVSRNVSKTSKHTKNHLGDNMGKSDPS